VVKDVNEDEDEEWIVWNGSQWIDCTWGDGGNDGLSTWYSFLPQSFDIKLHHFTTRKWAKMAFLVGLFG